MCSTEAIQRADRAERDTLLEGLEEATPSVQPAETVFYGPPQAVCKFEAATVHPLFC